MSARVATGGHIYQRIADLSRHLHSPQQAVDAIGQRAVDFAVSDVPAAQYAGICVITARSMKTLATSHPSPAILDEIQADQQQGPCFTATARRGIVRIDDLSEDTRWPLYCGAALPATSIRSVLTIWLFTSDQSTGALSLYADRPHAFTADTEDIGYVLATHTALAAETARREGRLQLALANRDVIGQAKGMLMSRLGIDEVDAFGLLKRLSDDQNKRLVDVARQIVARGDA
jgi:transcriptional regulator with GAF, ATPase, and Fis domain